jgi:hypothetical protein
MELLCGSKISVVATEAVPFEPPTRRTWPFGRTALAKDVLGEDITPAEENDPAVGSKISSEALAVPALSPPARRTRPSASNEAV